MSDEVHVEDDLLPSRRRTLCGLPLEGITVLRTLPLDWLEAVTCQTCRWAVIECVNEGGPPWAPAGDRP